MLSKEDREEGFSLVELLVVIVIIGILSAIAIGAFMNQRQKATEASLKSDLRTVATGVSTTLMDKDPDEIFELFDKNASYVANIDYETASTATEWNSIEELPELHVSDGNQVEIIIVSKTDARAWDTKAEPGEFCLSGSNRNSSYSYIPKVNTHADYDMLLYYDVKAGGVKTIEQLDNIVKAGGDISCKGYYNRWVAAHNK